MNLVLQLYHLLYVHKSTEQELSEDLIAIVQIYSSRQMSRRRYKPREPKEPKDKIEAVSISEVKT